MAGDVEASDVEVSDVEVSDVEVSVGVEASDAAVSDVAVSLLGAVRGLVLGLDPDVCDAVRVDRIRQLEELRGVLAAAQARETVAFVSSQRAEQRARGVAAQQVGRGVAAQVGLARRVSPFAASRYVAQVGVLIAELPATFARLRGGQVSEWRALLVARESAWLSAEHRSVLDAEIAPQLQHLGTRKTLDVVNQIACRLDPDGYLTRMEHAEKDRHVSVRPASGSMARLSALLPLPQAVGAYAALHTAARAIAGVGDEARTRAQVMADLLAHRLTSTASHATAGPATAGPATAGPATAGPVSVQVNLVMSDQAFFAAGEHAQEPATLLGGGIIPAALARRMAADPSGESEVFVRRLFTDPSTGQLAAMDSHSRCFTATQRRFLLLRDQSCRTPWCDAPIRHADHITPAHDGGPTTTANGQGLCETCNHTKQAPGWTQHPHPTTHQITTTTPTGHTYQSRAPAPPRTHAAA